jgi:hypothetical protein
MAACASTQVTQVKLLSADADAPYGNLLVISLFKSFDARRYLEKEIVQQLEAKGVNAVASTSRMDTRTPVTRKTFLAMVEDLDSDAVLVTQLVSLESQARFKDMRPESTYNVRQTYYYNVWNVELTEYAEPQGLDLKHSLRLATQVYSAKQLEAVWAIESQTEIVSAFDRRGDLSFVADEARAIVSHLSRDGLLSP